MKVILKILLLMLVKIVGSQENFNLDWPSAYITKFSNDINEVGDYNYQVQSSDGQYRGEKRTGTELANAIVEGFYSYLGLDGKRYTVGYTADDNGFHPEGEHLPASAGVRRRPPQVGVPPDFAIKKAPLQSILGTSSG